MTHSCIFQKLTLALYSWVAFSSKWYKWLLGQLRMPDLGSSESFCKENFLATALYKEEPQKCSPINLEFISTKPDPDVSVLESQPCFNIDQMVYLHITSTLRPCQ